MTPRYRSIDPERFGLARRLRGLAAPLGADTVAVGVYEGQAASTPRVRVYLVDHKPSFDRDGIYGDAKGDYADNARRFALLGSAALALAAEFGTWPDVVHGHDWQAGPAILFAKRRWGDLPPPKTVFTIHNLAFQGLFPEKRGRRARAAARAITTRAASNIYGPGELLEGGPGAGRPFVDGEPALRARDPDAGIWLRFRRAFAARAVRDCTAS